MRVVKRYPNRKLYDTEAKRYITLDAIATLIRSAGGQHQQQCGSKDNHFHMNLLDTTPTIEAPKPVPPIPLSPFEGVVSRDSATGDGHGFVLGLGVMMLAGVAPLFQRPLWRRLWL